MENRNNYEERNPFLPFYEADIMPLIELFADEALKKDMHKFAEAEDYRMAAIYRNELIRRGKL